MRFPILRSIIAPVAGAVVAGTVVIAGLSLGFYAWPLFVLALGAGVVLGLPIGMWTVRRMRATAPISRPASPSMDPDAAQREVKPWLRVAYPPAASQGRVDA